MVNQLICINKYAFMFTVYMIKNKINGKIYIGKTHLSVKQRFKTHLYAANYKPLTYFHKAINKYGIENFEISVLDTCETNEQANVSEMYYISKYNTQNPEIGYNLTKGGEGVVGRKQSPEQIEKHRQKLLGRPLSEETKLKISKANKGKICSEAQKALISAKNKGENNGCWRKPASIESRISRGLKVSITKKNCKKENIIVSDITKAKLSEISKNRESEKVSDDIKDEIVLEYKKGNVTKQDLSEKYNLKFSVINNILRYWEKVRVNNLTRVSKVQKEEIIDLYKLGIDYITISEKSGISVKKIKNICKVYKRKNRLNLI